MKYLIRARIEVDGRVDKPDIVGAIFGQTEGLFAPDFELRDLQEKGRIGRIIVDIRHQGNKTVGEILLPSNLDRAETALIAAMLESVDKVGPYNARITLIDIVDVRREKIKKIIERAREILKKWGEEKGIDIKEVIRQIEEAVKKEEIIAYGPERLPAGPEVEHSDTLIIVEGRADVLNLLRYGYKNAIAIGGAKGEIPRTVVELSKRKKKVIAFVDGDHAGDLILRHLLSAAKVDLVARAPPGREVEELTGKEIMKALKNAVPVDVYLQAMEKKPETKPPKPRPAPAPEELAEETIQVPQHVIDTVKALRGTLEAVLYDEKWREIKRLPVRDLVDTLASGQMRPYAVVMDGIITQRVVDAASVSGVKLIIGARVGVISKRPPDVIIVTFDDILH